MTSTTYPEAMQRIFADEGGYTNDPRDPGGATNWGITIYDVRRYLMPNATPADVKRLTKDQASAIYKKHYADAVAYDLQPAGVDYAVLDAQINSGRGLKWETQALGQAGAPNELAIAAQRAPDKVALIKRIYGIRTGFLRNLGTFDAFGKGWMRRCTGGEAAAVAMWLRATSQPVAPAAQQEQTKAQNKAKQQGGTVAGGGAAGGTATQVDTSGLDWTQKGVLIVLAAVVALCLIGLGYHAYRNWQRGKAYAEVAAAH